MIAEAALDICELEEEVAAANRHRYAFYRMLAATDRLLWRLEELNQRNMRVLPADEGARMRESLDELPVECRERFIADASVQVTLDSVFEVQEALFRWHDPTRPVEETSDEVPAETPGLRDRIKQVLAGHPWLSHVEIGHRCEPHGSEVRRLLPIMAELGEILCDQRRYPTGGRTGRFYALPGAGERNCG